MVQAIYTYMCIYVKSRRSTRVTKCKMEKPFRVCVNSNTIQFIVTLNQFRVEELASNN